MTPFKGVRKGDVIEVQTAAESGYAKVETVTDRGVDYVPIGGAWQPGRFNRPPATARQITAVYRRLNR